MASVERDRDLKESDPAEREALEGQEKALVREMLRLVRGDWLDAALPVEARRFLPSLLLGVYIANLEGKRLSKREACAIMNADPGTSGPKNIALAEECGFIIIERKPAEDKRKDFLKATPQLTQLIEQQLASLARLTSQNWSMIFRDGERTENARVEIVDRQLSRPRPSSASGNQNHDRSVTASAGRFPVEDQQLAVLPRPDNPIVTTTLFDRTVHDLVVEAAAFSFGLGIDGVNRLYLLLLYLLTSGKSTAAELERRGVNLSLLREDCAFAITQELAATNVLTRFSPAVHHIKHLLIHTSFHAITRKVKMATVEDLLTEIVNSESHYTAVRLLRQHCSLEYRGSGKSAWVASYNGGDVIADVGNWLKDVSAALTHMVNNEPLDRAFGFTATSRRLVSEFISDAESALTAAESMARSEADQKRWHRTRSNLHIAIGKVLVFQGNLSAAKEFYHKAIEIDPNSEVAYVARADRYAAEGDLDRAIVDYTKAIDFNPHKAIYFFARGNAYHDSGDDHAIADYTMAINIDPNDADYFSARAHAFEHQGEYDRAISDLIEAVKLRPMVVGYHCHLGIIRFTKGDFKLAAADLSRATELDEDGHTTGVNARRFTYTMLFLYLARSREGEDAASELERNASRLETRDWPYPLIELCLGWSLPQEALNAAATEEERGEAQFFVAEWHLVQGNKVAAIEMLKTFIDSAPNPGVDVEHRAAVEELKRLRP